MHRKFGELLEIDEGLYAEATARIRKTLGSYDTISSLLFKHTDVLVTANAVRRWFNYRKIPVEYAFFFSQLTDNAVTVLDFYPWLAGRAGKPAAAEGAISHV